MSICSNSFRALPRYHIAPVRIFLPFLYHTVTIRQWKAAVRPLLARRTITSRSDRKYYVPFEDGTFQPQNEDAENAQQRSTITGSERAAFQKLYRKFNTEGRAKSDRTHFAEIDQIADEYYEDDEEDPSRGLDDLFDKVLQGSRYSRGSRLAVRKKRSGEDVDASIEGNPPVSRSMAQSKKREAKAEAAQLTQLRTAERQRVDMLLQNAQTDHELWQLLDREVFDQVRRLDLDRSTKDMLAKEKDESERPEVDPRILFKNYPHHLITALLTLRTAFSASFLPLSFLPTIKSLGRSAYALGATTTLYQHLIRYVWLQRSSYSQIDRLLIDMNNSAIEFDSGILEVLDAVIKEHDMALSSQLGREMQMVYQMEQFFEGIKKIKEWRRVIAERLGISASVEERDRWAMRGRRLTGDSWRGQQDALSGEEQEMPCMRREGGMAGESWRVHEGLSAEEKKRLSSEENKKLSREKKERLNRGEKRLTADFTRPRGGQSKVRYHMRA